MLVLSRKCQEKIRITGNIVITITRIEGNRVGIGIEAPDSLDIRRSEPCVICSRPTFGNYLGYRDIPFCGDDRCGYRIRINGQVVKAEGK